MNKSIGAGILGLASLLAGCNGMKIASRNVVHILERELGQSGQSIETVYSVGEQRHYMAAMRAGDDFLVLESTADALSCNTTFYTIKRDGAISDKVLLEMPNGELGCRQIVQPYPLTKEQKNDALRGLNLIISEYVN